MYPRPERQDSARSRAARLVGPPCVASTSSTGSSSSGRSAARICSGGTPLFAQSVGTQDPDRGRLACRRRRAPGCLRPRGRGRSAPSPGTPRHRPAAGRQPRTRVPRPGSDHPRPAAARRAARRAAPPGYGHRARATGTSARSPSRGRPQALRSRSVWTADRTTADGCRCRSRMTRPARPSPLPASQCHTPVCSPRTGGMIIRQASR